MASMNYMDDSYESMATGGLDDFKMLDERLDKKEQERSQTYKEVHKDIRSITVELIKSAKNLADSIQKNPIKPNWAFQKMVNDMKNLLDQDFKNKNSTNLRQIERALSGYYQKIEAREIRDNFLNKLRKLIGDINYSIDLKQNEQVKSELERVKSELETFLRKVESTPIKGGDDGNYTCEMTPYTGSGNSDCMAVDSDSVYGLGGSVEGGALGNTLHDLDKQFRRLNYFYNLYAVKENLKDTAKELEEYGKNYDDVLGSATAKRIQEIKDEYQRYLKSPLLADGYPNKGLILKYIEKERDSKIGLYTAAIAVDEYLRIFTREMALNLDDLKELSVMLNKTEVIQDWTSAEMVEDLEELFKTIPNAKPGNTGAAVITDANLSNAIESYYNNNSNGSSANATYNGIIRSVLLYAKKDKIFDDDYKATRGVDADAIAAAKWTKLTGANNYNKDDLKAKRQFDSGQPGDGPVSEQLMVHLENFYEQFGALKNIVSLFTYLGEKFGGKSIYDNSKVMKPGQIYNLLMKYLIQSTFSLITPTSVNACSTANCTPLDPPVQALALKAIQISQIESTGDIIKADAESMRDGLFKLLTDFSIANDDLISESYVRQLKQKYSDEKLEKLNDEDYVDKIRQLLNEPNIRDAMVGPSFRNNKNSTTPEILETETNVSAAIRDYNNKKKFYDDYLALITTSGEALTEISNAGVSYSYFSDLVGSLKNDILEDNTTMVTEFTIQAGKLGVNSLNVPYGSPALTAFIVDLAAITGNTNLATNTNFGNLKQPVQAYVTDQFNNINAVTVGEKNNLDKLSILLNNIGAAARNVDLSAAALNDKVKQINDLYNAFYALAVEFSSSGLAVTNTVYLGLVNPMFDISGAVNDAFKDNLSKYLTNINLDTGSAINNLQNYENFMKIAEQVKNNYPSTPVGIAKYSITEDLYNKFVTNANNNFRKENEIFNTVLHAMCGKIITVIGAHNLLDVDDGFVPQPIDQQRIIMGGASSHAEVIPEAVELYVRLPLLAEYYKYVLTPGNVNAPTDTSKTFAMLPDSSGVFGDLIDVVWRYSDFKTTGRYSEFDTRGLINAINPIYNKFKGENDPVRSAINEFMSEINRRYAIYTKQFFARYHDEVYKKDKRTLQTGKAYNRKEYELPELLPGEEDSNLPTSIADKYLKDRKSKDSESLTDNDTPYNISSEMKKMVFEMRNRMEEITNRGSATSDLRELGLRNLKNEIIRETSNERRLQLVYKNLGSDASIVAGSNITQPIIVAFYELFLMPLQTLGLMTSQFDLLTKATTGIYQKYNNNLNNVLQAAYLVSASKTYANANQRRNNYIFAIMAAKREAIKYPELSAIINLISQRNAQPDAAKLSAFGILGNVNLDSIDTIAKIQYLVRHVIIYAVASQDPIFALNYITSPPPANPTDPLVINTVDGADLKIAAASVAGGILNQDGRNTRQKIALLKAIDNSGRFSDVGISPISPVVDTFLTVIETFMATGPPTDADAKEFIDNKYANREEYDKLNLLACTNPDNMIDFEYRNDILTFNVQKLEKTVLPILDKLRRLSFVFKAAGIDVEEFVKKKNDEGTLNSLIEKFEKYFDRDYDSASPNEYLENKLNVINNNFPNYLFTQIEAIVQRPTGLSLKTVMILNESQRYQHLMSTNDPATKRRRMDVGTAFRQTSFYNWDNPLEQTPSGNSGVSILVTFNRLLVGFIKDFSSSVGIYQGLLSKLYNGVFSSNFFTRTGLPDCFGRNAGGSVPSSNFNGQFYETKAIYDAYFSGTYLPGVSTTERSTAVPATGFNQVFAANADTNVNGFVTSKLTPENGILKSIAVMINNIFNNRMNETYELMVESLSDLSESVKDRHRVLLPVYIRLFNNLKCKCKLTEFVVDKSAANDDQKETAKRFLKKFSAACGEMLDDCKEVLKSLTNEKPKFFEIEPNFISKYQSENGHAPFMPLSSTLLLQQYKADNILPSGKARIPGKEEYKTLRGMLPFINYDNISYDQLIGVKNIVEQFNSAVGIGNGINESDISELMLLTSHVIKFNMDNAYFKNYLSVIPSLPSDFIKIDSAGVSQLLRTANAELLINLTTSTKFEPNVYKTILPDQTAAGTIVKLTAAGVASAVGNPTLLKDDYNDGLLGVDSAKAIVSNIIELNVVPLNVHATMREVAFANLYNYSYMYLDMLAERAAEAIITVATARANELETDRRNCKYAIKYAVTNSTQYEIVAADPIDTYMNSVITAEAANLANVQGYAKIAAQILYGLSHPYKYLQETAAAPVLVNDTKLAFNVFSTNNLIAAPTANAKLRLTSNLDNAVAGKPSTVVDFAAGSERRFERINTNIMRHVLNLVNIQYKMKDYLKSELSKHNNNSVVSSFAIVNDKLVEN